MGASASFSKPSKVSKFDEIELNCKRNVYENNLPLFRSTVVDAISNGRIDILELLITSKFFEGMLPIHIACSVSNLESLEILLSAGFPLNAFNEKGVTPLHCCAGSTTPYSALCATAIILSAKNRNKVLKTKNAQGDTALIIAIRAHNLDVVEAICDNTIDPDTTILNICDRLGKSPLMIAQELQYRGAVRLLLGKRQPHQLSNSPKSRGDEVSRERMMLVWEKFFENALMAMGESFEESGESAKLCQSPNLCLYKHAGKSGIDAGSCHDSYFDDVSDGMRAFSIKTSSIPRRSNKSNEKKKKLSIDEAIEQLVSVWIRYFEEGSAYYYNKETGESRWEVPVSGELEGFDIHSLIENASDATVMDKWTECWDEVSGCVYYFNETTGESSWGMGSVTNGIEEFQNPNYYSECSSKAAGEVGVASQSPPEFQDAYASTAKNDENPSSASEPYDYNGWVEYIDPDTQCPYYYNLFNGCSCWEWPPPEELNPNLSANYSSVLGEESSSAEWKGHTTYAEDKISGSNTGWDMWNTIKSDCKYS